MAATTPETDQPTVRMFIALAVPAGVKDAILQAQDKLRRALPERCARWTRSGQWHLTLKFLGDVETERVDELIESVRAACKPFAPLLLTAAGVGCFPDLRRPRVLWVGVQEAGKLLERLAVAVDGATQVCGEKRAEKFTAHITLARITNITRPEAEMLSRLVREMNEGNFGSWTADAVEIMKSELLPDGARHTCLARLPLAKEP